MKYSASVRMMPFSGWLNQVAATPTTDSSRRSRMVTTGRLPQQARPAGVCRTGSSAVRRA